MKIHTQNSPAFSAGLTLKMRQEIASVDIGKISAEFARNNIQTDFKGNKTIAWCALKSLEILKSLKLGLPKGVFVESFEELYTENESLGFCNIAPSRVYRAKDNIVPEKTIFFNNQFNWDNLDSMADANFESNESPTDFFLDTILHEFAHSAHETSLLDKFNSEKLQRLIRFLLHQKNLNKFRQRYYEILRPICNYALTNQFEATACDFTKRVISNMDRNTLKVSEQFKKSNPYVWRSIFSPSKDDVLEDTMRRFWRGKFEY